MTNFEIERAATYATGLADALEGKYPKLPFEYAGAYAVGYDDGYSQRAKRDANMEKYTKSKTNFAYYKLHIAELAQLVHSCNSKWWVDPATGLPRERNVGEMLMLIVSELAEAMEGHRKSLMDDKLPQFPMITVELADALIRIMDMAGGLKLDLAGAWAAKMEYNLSREDHKLEARVAPGGKKY